VLGQERPETFSITLTKTLSWSNVRATDRVLADNAVRLEFVEFPEDIGQSR